VRVGTWNVGSLMSKLREVVDTLIRQFVNILCI
jgi:exonuclease III